MKVILASTSPYRQAQLKQLRLPFLAVSPGVDEAQIKTQGFPPREVARRLAELKGSSVLERHPDALIIAADQVVHLDGVVLSKPGTAERARAQLEKMAGRSHELVTALWLHHPTRGPAEHIDTAMVTMRRLTGLEIERYVEIDQPLDCAGSYKFESAGIGLIEKVVSEDPTSIVGLPLLALTSLLRLWQLPLPIQWPEERDTP